MGDFKFACPVCGQHITADSSTSGTQLECPTCFRKIIVPQAPKSADSKLILSASQVGGPRPVPTEATADPLAAPSKHSPLPSILLVLALAAGGAAVFFFRGKIFSSSESKTGTNVASARPRRAHSTYPIPTNLLWTLDLTNATIPDTPAAGSIHGSGFFCERSILQGGNLSLRQGASWPPDLGVSVLLHAQAGEELSGKTVEIWAERTPPVPK